MTRPPQRLRSYRRFQAALQTLPGIEDAAELSVALRVINHRLLAIATGRADDQRVSDRDEPLAEAVGALFDGWDWRDAGPDAPGEDLLGYLFEHSLARKTLGAYFTPPDVVTYIVRGVVIPRLFDLLALQPDLRALAGDEGVFRYLPPWVVSEDRIPLETDNEYRCRRMRVAETRTDFDAGRITSLDDCVTRNLDLQRIAVDYLEREPDERKVSALLECLREIRILDPTCGSGDFLLGAFDLLASLMAACYARLQVTRHAGALSLACLHGIDLLPGAIEICRMRMRLRLRQISVDGTVPPGAGASLVSGDFIDATQTPGGEFDIVIGNPPYVRSTSDRQQLAALGYRTAGCGNLYAPVMERSLRLLARGGRLGMVVPISSVSGAEYRPLAEQLLPGAAWVSTYSNRPAKLFDGVEQRLAIWLVSPDAPRATFASAYQHWRLEERDLLFERLQYAPAPCCNATGMPAKTGSSLANSIFAKLSAHRHTLGELAAGGNSHVWLHDAPTYWVRALTFEPNQGRKSGRSGHYRRLATANAESAQILAAVLSSSTFYLFFKLTSNCRDLGRSEWSRFPINPLPGEARGRLSATGEALQQALRVSARIRTRVYPSGPVEYEEYFPALAKSALDEIDRILAAHYGLTEPELEHILEYDLKYRMGRGDGDGRA